LDGVRGLAIFAVMALHFVCSQILQPQNKIEYIALRLTGYGAWGVDLFFVLSGFLITGILWDSRGSQGYFKTFYARRTLRIFPLYYGTLLVMLVLVPTSVLAHYAPEVLQLRPVQGWFWSYLANVYVAKVETFKIPYIAHFWTLAIEEHFYLFWPFVVGLLSRRTTMRVCVGASALALGLRLLLGALGYSDYYRHVLTPCRLDALCIGAWLALAVREPGGFAAFAPSARRGVVLGAVGVLATSIVHMLRPGDMAADSVRETFLAVLFGCSITLVAWPDGPALVKSWLRARWLRFLGKYSYGIYVIHGIFAYAFGAHYTLDFIQRWTGGRGSALVVQGVLGSVASVLLAVLSFELFESRFLRLKARFPSVAPRHDANKVLTGP
jgi:peptidoglycan/LPS O-acetylase OafA/YrhL